jgi:hypothetical protein
MTAIAADDFIGMFRIPGELALLMTGCAVGAIDVLQPGLDGDEGDDIGFGEVANVLGLAKQLR